MNLSRIITTIDTHTAGEPTRIVTGGIPYIPGATMQGKKQWMRENEDDLRKMLIWEPRGHRDMFGAILTAPVSPDAHIGIIYMDSEGYLDMCVHGSIGSITAMIETGIIRFEKKSSQVQNIILDTPAGKVESFVSLKNGRVESVTIRNVPSFFYDQINIEVPDFGIVPVSVSYAGNYFGIVDCQYFNLSIEQKNIEKFIHYGLAIRESVNRALEIRHPGTGELGKVNLVEFFEETAPPRNVVIFGSGQADRSPCGTGTGAKMAWLHSQKKLGIGELYPYRSIIGTEFVGEILAETTVGDRRAIIPTVTGRAYITGLQKFVFDEEDPFKYGFGSLKSA